MRLSIKVADKMGTNDSPNNAAKGNATTEKMADLLVKEMEEINNWARLAFQIYFGWFALQFTVNGFAMGWIFTHSLTPPATRLASLIFIGWNLMGTLQTFFTRRDLLDCDSRIGEVIGLLTLNEASTSTTQSSIPRRGIKTVFAFCTLTMCMSLAFWLTLEFWPQILFNR